MIIINIQGGLGNQLFQYAFAYSLAKRFRIIFLIDDGLSPFILSDFFEVKDWNVYSLIRNKYFKKIFRKIIRNVKQQKNIDFTDCFLQKESLEIVNRAYYEGYFQSLAYFENYEQEIRKIFKIKNKYQEAFNQKYEMLFTLNKVLVLHIRRTDYLTHGNGKNLGKSDLSLPISYYQNILSEIINLSDYTIMIIGDDMEFARKHFSFLPNVIIEQNEMIIDFQILMNADVVVMSNSTFAWWGAYLNNKRHKKIYAPKYFLGFHIKEEFPAGISYQLSYFWREVNE